jgi:hypothetical protein
LRTEIIKRWILLIAGVIASGCGVTRSTYSYRASTANCNCEEYRATDAKHRIDYRFRARYIMDRGVHTNITVTFVNSSRDTLFLDPGAVRISSRNVSYQYNDKFIPLPHVMILPLSSDSVSMTGSEVTGEDDWNKIAGEQLTLTIQGIRLGELTLPQQQVTFIPENPRLSGNK